MGIWTSLLFLLLNGISVIRCDPTLLTQYWAHQVKFRPCAQMQLPSGLSTILPVGYTFFKNATLYNSWQTTEVHPDCRLEMCSDGAFQTHCQPLQAGQTFLVNASSSLDCSCTLLVPESWAEFNRTQTGVVFSPYVKNWMEVNKKVRVPKWNTYTMEDIKRLLAILAKTFSTISTYGIGATAPSVSWKEGDSTGLVPVAAAELNQELAALGKPTLSLTQGIWYGSVQYPEILQQEINNAFEASDYANRLFPGTVTGLIFTSHHVTDNQTGMAVNKILDANRARAQRMGLQVGVRLDICQRILGAELPEDINQLHGVPQNYTYSEFKNPDLEFIFRNLVERVDFLICHYDTPTAYAYQPMSYVVESLGSDFEKMREVLRTLRPNLTVVAQTGWPSWGYSNNGSPNNLSNLLLFWNQMSDWATKTHFPLLLFESFDEPWKNDLTQVENSGPKGPVGAEGLYGWWRRHDTNQTLTYIPKIQDAELPETEADIYFGLETVFVAMGLILVVVLGIIFGFVWRLRKERNNLVTRSTNKLAKDFRSGSRLSECEETELTTDENECRVIALQFPYNRKYEIPRNKFSYDESCILGQGNSGIVYKGHIQGLPQPVAFKMLKAEASVTDLKNLLSEIKIMSYVGQHEFIVNLLGAHTAKIEQGEVFVAAEFCELGSLESYLKAQRGHFSTGLEARSVQTPSNGYVVACFETETEPHFVKSVTITLTDLLKWSYQIAAGLEHIARKKVIHADVASRNVLLSGDGTAKITDFGLSRQLYYKTEYLKSNNREKLPWRWMAIESLRSAHFSIMSDVWSFGVTLWEIFSLAQLPYPGVTDWGEQFLLKLEQDNYRMLPPPHATPQINALMEGCWRQTPSERISIGELKESLQDLYERSRENKTHN